MILVVQAVFILSSVCGIFAIKDDSVTSQAFPVVANEFPFVGLLAHYDGTKYDFIRTCVIALTNACYTGRPWKDIGAGEEYWVFFGDEVDFYGRSKRRHISNYYINHLTIIFLFEAFETRDEVQVPLGIPSPNQYLHCELVGWYVNWTSLMITKTLMPIEVDNHIDEEYMEVKPLFKLNALKGKTYNPCLYKFNLGAPIICDVQLRAMFFGDIARKCTNPTDISKNVAFYPDAKKFIHIQMIIPPSKPPYDYVFNEYDTKLFNEIVVNPTNDENELAASKLVAERRYACARAIYWRIDFRIFIFLLLLKML